MSYCDRLYPGNPKRRQRAERLYQQLSQCMPPNAGTTNRLMGVMEDQLLHQFRLFNEAPDCPLRQDCRELVLHLQAIRKKIHQVDKKLKEELDPTSYAHLRGIAEPNTEATIKLHSYIALVLWIFTALVMCIGLPGICICIALYSHNILLAIFAQVSACSTFVLVCVCLCFGVDILLSTALGALEKCQLKKCIKQYEKKLNIFQQNVLVPVQTLIQP